MKEINSILDMHVYDAPIQANHHVIMVRNQAKIYGSFDFLELIEFVFKMKKCFEKSLVNFE